MTSYPLPLKEFVKAVTEGSAIKATAVLRNHFDRARAEHLRPMRDVIADALSTAARNLVAAQMEDRYGIEFNYKNPLRTAVVDYEEGAMLWCRECRRPLTEINISSKDLVNILTAVNAHFEEEHRG